jgi:hypothetical protein
LIVVIDFFSEGVGERPAGMIPESEGKDRQVLKGFNSSGKTTRIWLQKLS